MNLDALSPERNEEQELTDKDLAVVCGGLPSDPPHSGGRHRFRHFSHFRGFRDSYDDDDCRIVPTPYGPRLVCAPPWWLR